MRKSGKIILTLGCLLMAGGLVLLLVAGLQNRRADRQNAAVLAALETVLPDRREGLWEPDRTTEMPALELLGRDYIALLEIPAYGLRLPVRSAWDSREAEARPCRFFGTAYNGSLVIGGYDRAGQFDFFDRIMEGTEIRVTDMTGAVFAYRVSRVDRSDSADAGVLAGRADLTLFVRDAQLLQYILLRCEGK